MLYPHVCKVMQFFDGSISDNGLIEHVPLWVFVDWAAVDKNGASAVLNALFYGTLEYVERMAEFKQDGFMSEYCRSARERIASAFDKLFWDEERQVYIDSYAKGVRSRNVSEHTNALAILYGLADRGKSESIIRAIFVERSVRATEAQPFFTFFVLLALESAGRLDLAIETIRSRWNRMLSQGATSTWEEWGHERKLAQRRQLFSALAQLVACLVGWAARVPEQEADRFGHRRAEICENSAETGDRRIAALLNRISDPARCVVR
jgi:hypothetical protein